MVANTAPLDCQYTIANDPTPNPPTLHPSALADAPILKFPLEYSQAVLRNFSWRILGSKNDGTHRKTLPPSLPPPNTVANTTTVDDVLVHLITSNLSTFDLYVLPPSPTPPTDREKVLGQGLWGQPHSPPRMRQLFPNKCPEIHRVYHIITLTYPLMGSEVRHTNPLPSAPNFG